MLYFWIILGILLLLIEVMQPIGLFLCCGLSGWIVGLVLWIFGISLPIQFLLFAIISVLFVIFLRSIIKRFSNKNFVKELTGPRSMIGKEAFVHTTIDNTKNTGAISYYGDVWKARSIHDELMERGTRVRIVKMESIVVFVEKIK